MSSMPLVENLHKKGPEVLRVVDPADECTVQQPKELDGRKLESTTKEGFDLGDAYGKNKLEELKAIIVTGGDDDYIKK